MKASIMSKLSLMTACLAVGLVTQVEGGVVAPNPTYTATFNTAADTADFIPRVGTNDGAGLSDTWNVANGGWEHSMTTVYNSSNGGSQILQTSGVAGQNFTVSTTVTILNRDLRGSGWNIVMPILANHETQSYWSSDTFYTVGVNMSDNWSGGADSFSIASSDVSTVTWNPIVLASQPLSSNLVVDGQYTMSVTGTYSGGSLTLDAVMKQGNTVLASIQAFEANPKSGNYFGISESTGWGSNTSLRYSDYAIAVPEPATAGLLGLVSLSALARRRRLA